MEKWDIVEKVIFCSNEVFGFDSKELESDF